MHTTKAALKSTGKYSFTEKGTMERKALTKNSAGLFVPVQEMSAPTIVVLNNALSLGTLFSRRQK